jgi:YD repeat-containing protein
MKKILTRLCALCLALVLAVGLCAAPALAYADVDGTRWYAPCIDEVTDLGLMDGMGIDAFQPESTLTRAMTVTVLWRLAGEPAATTSSPFTDVPASTWYTQAVAWAAETGAVNGTTPTTFAPTDPVTREQLATIFYRYTQSIQGDTALWGTLSRSNLAAVSSWAVDGVTWASGRFFLTNRDTSSLSPKAAATRAEVAVFLARFAGSLPEESDLASAQIVPVLSSGGTLELVLSSPGQEVYPTLSVNGNKGLCNLALSTTPATGTAPAGETLGYDEQGRLTTVSDANSMTEYTIQYDGHGNPAFVSVKRFGGGSLVVAVHYTDGEDGWRWSSVAVDGGVLRTPAESGTVSVFDL